MNTLFLSCDLIDIDQAFSDISKFFGRDFNLIKKIFSNDLDFIKKQSNEKELLIITTKLSPFDIEGSFKFKKLCVVSISIAADVLEYNILESLSLRDTIDIRQKYGTVLYTNELYCKQSFVLDRYDIFGFVKAVFVFSNGLNVDIDSYMGAGFKFIGIVK